MMLLRILPLPAIFLVAGTIYGQESSELSILIDETKPSVYIQYDTPLSGIAEAREKIGKNSDKQVRLRLFNNTTGMIKIRKPNFYSSARNFSLCYFIVKNPAPESSIEKAAYRAELRVDWKFEFWSYERVLRTISMLPGSFCNGHIIFSDTIAPGESVLFTVPRDYLVSNYILGIDFDYEWEKGHGEAIHDVVFSKGDLQEADGEAIVPNLIKTTPAREMLLDVNKSSVYVRYVKSQKSVKKRDRDEEGAMFWLFNNTRKAIRIPTESIDHIPLDSRPVTRYLILDDGKDVLAMRHGSRIYPCYMEKESEPVLRRINNSDPEFVPDRDFSLPFSPDCSMRSVSWVASGENVLFIVPYDHLNPDYALYIPFNYEWEKETSNVIHSIKLSPRRIWQEIAEEH